MDLRFVYDSQQASLKLDFPSDVWRNHGKKGIEEYILLTDTGLAPPIRKVFVKRLAKRRADGHDLLMSCPTRQIKYTPLFLGYTEEGGWHYYVYSLLEECLELGNVFENAHTHHGRLI